MDEKYQFIEKCLKELNDPEKEEQVTWILEELYSDLIFDKMPPEMNVAIQLKNIGEDSIVEKYINPLIAKLDDNQEQE